MTTQPDALNRADRRRVTRGYVTQEEAAEYLGVTSRTIPV